MPAHVGTLENKKADIEAKKAISLKKMRKQNNKVVEIDTKYIVLLAYRSKLL